LLRLDYYRPRAASRFSVKSVKIFLRPLDDEQQHACSSQIVSPALKSER